MRKSLLELKKVTFGDSRTFRNYRYLGGGHETRSVFTPLH